MQPMVRFSKFTLNIEIYEYVEGFLSKLVWRETLFGAIIGFSNFNSIINNKPTKPNVNAFLFNK